MTKIYGEDTSHNGRWDGGIWTRKETGGYITRIDIAVLWNAVDDAVEKRNELKKWPYPTSFPFLPPLLSNFTLIPLTPGICGGGSTLEALVVSEESGRVDMGVEESRSE